MPGTAATEVPAATSLPRRLYHRFRGLIHELGKFGTVGALAYLVDLSIFNVCEIVLDLHWFPSAVISTAIAASVAFVGNRFWTWRDRPRSGLGREYALFFLLNTVGLAIGLACLWFSHSVLGSLWPGFRTVLADNIAKQVVGMALGTLFRFWSYRRYVFPAAGPAGTAHAPTGASPVFPDTSSADTVTISTVAADTGQHLPGVAGVSDDTTPQPVTEVPGAR